MNRKQRRDAQKANRKSGYFLTTKEARRLGKTKRAKKRGRNHR